jgi:hypothetical protein
MALDDAALEDFILSFLESTAASASDAAAHLAALYAAYASQGTFAASTVTIDGARESALAVTLAAGLVPAPVPATFLAALAAGLATFWTGVPVVGTQAGATVGCPGAASLPAVLAAALAVPNDRETAAQALAAALHTATLTVTAAVVPDPTPLPIA